MTLYQLAQNDSSAAFTLWLKENKATAPLFPYGEGEEIKMAPAFRDLKWFRAQNDFTVEYNEALFKNIQSLSILVAGIKKALYTLVFSYTGERMQGGRYLRDWPLIATQLSSLSTTIERDQNHLKNLNFKLALDILGEADQFASQCLQILGGVGYTEAFKAEKYFREIVFLKNWLAPFSELKR